MSARDHCLSKVVRSTITQPPLRVVQLLTFGTMVASLCWIDGNTAAADAGAIMNSGSCNLNGCEVNGNQVTANASFGGGVVNASGAFFMNGGTLQQNTAIQNGGGIFSTGSGATATFTNVTIKGNGAQTGGGFFLDSGSLTLKQSTLSGNTAQTGNGGVYRVDSIYTDGGGNTI